MFHNLQRELQAEIKFLEAKENGAQATRINDYMTAVYWYTEVKTLKLNYNLAFNYTAI